jgi:hypothetical protein
MNAVNPISRRTVGQSAPGGLLPSAMNASASTA